MYLLILFNTCTLSHILTLAHACTFPHLLWWTIPFANYTIRISIELVVKIITKCVNAVQTNCWISLIWWLKSNTSKQTRACTYINLLIHASNYYCVTHLAVLIFKIIFAWKLSFIKLTLSERLKGPLRLIHLPAQGHQTGVWHLQTAD